MARPTGKKRRENQAAAAKVRAENREKRLKEQQESIAAKATGRTKAAKTKVAARLKIQNEGKANETKPKAKKRGLMTKFEKQQAEKKRKSERAKAWRNRNKK